MAKEGTDGRPHLRLEGKVVIASTCGSCARTGKVLGTGGLGSIAH